MAEQPVRYVYLRRYIGKGSHYQGRLNIWHKGKAEKMHTCGRAVKDALGQARLDGKKCDRDETRSGILIAIGINMKSAAQVATQIRARF